MSIMEEAYGYHRLEMDDRIEKYHDSCVKDMERKAERWNVILVKHQDEELLSDEEIIFMLDELKLSFFLSDVPYLKGHIERLQREVEIRKVLTHFEALILKQQDFVESLSLMYTGFIKRKKRLLDWVCRSQAVREADDYTYLLGFIRTGEISSGEWMVLAERYRAIREQWDTGVSLNQESLDWLMMMSKWSIEAQITSSDIFFSHHFDQVSRKQHFIEKLEEYAKIFTEFDRVIKLASEMEAIRFQMEYWMSKVSSQSQKVLDEIRYKHYRTMRNIREIAKAS